MELTTDGVKALPLAAGQLEEFKDIRNLLIKARTAWLKNTEVLDVLSNYASYNFNLNRTTPNRPPGEPPPHTDFVWCMDTRRQQGTACARAA